MGRRAWFWVCAIAGLLLLAVGLLMPIYLRAVDVGVLNKASKGTPKLAEVGLGVAAGQGLGAAQLLLSAAKADRLPDASRLELVVGKLAQEHPDWAAWGGADSYLAKVFKTSSTNAGEPFTEIVIRAESREAGLKLLRMSSSPAVRELLRCRALTNMVIFPPSSSASGQAFDAAIVTGGLLMNDLHLSPTLSNSVYQLSASANRGGGSGPIEEVLVDFMSLGQRLNWGQLTVFVTRIENPETLHRLADQMRLAGTQLPVLFSAVQLSGNPAGVASYLQKFNDTGMKNLRAGLQFGAGGLNEMLRRGQQLHFNTTRQNFTRGWINEFYNFLLGYCLSQPQLALVVKWILYFACGVFIAGALHFAKPAISFLEEPLQVRGVQFGRELLFALGFLLVMLMLSEPFLAQDSQKAPEPPRLRLPSPGSAITAGTKSTKPSIMNQQSNLSLLTLLAFFVLQGLLYLSCLLKLAEIRRQRVTAEMKLKLLENEEHLFDAGLYLGFAGTIVSLILVSLHIANFSLMAAYSSTSFGIIFVSIFKICNLRPVRRKLLLEADAATREPAASMSSATPAVTQP